MRVRMSSLIKGLLACLLLLSFVSVLHAADERAATVKPQKGTTYRDPTTGMEFVFVKGGCYQMGDTFGDGYNDEKPVHEVCVDDFYMGKYDVTVGDFRKFVNDTGYRTEAETGDGCYGWMGGKFEKQSGFSWKNPGFSQDERHPVACVSWNDAKAYADWMQRKSSEAARLPTEAEWEYAARGGTTGRNYWGSRVEDACGYANVADRAAKRQFSSWTVHECDDGYVYTSPVGSFKSNAFGLYDMMGNVWQWTGDWYGENYYGESPKNNPTGPNSGEGRVLRGGSWSSTSADVRAAFRNGETPASRGSSSGFRLVLSAR